MALIEVTGRTFQGDDSSGKRRDGSGRGRNLGDCRQCSAADSGGGEGEGHRADDASHFANGAKNLRHAIS